MELDKSIVSVNEFRKSFIDSINNNFKRSGFFQSYISTYNNNNNVNTFNFNNNNFINTINYNNNTNKEKVFFDNSFN
jgi:hypothetical protein